MGSDELRLRANWQTVSEATSIATEQNFFSVFESLLKDTRYRITDKPKEFMRIYENWPLPTKEIEAIYNPDKPYRHGFAPDYSIENLKTHKKIFIEVKRQDGWIEGLPRSVGAEMPTKDFASTSHPG